MAEDGNVQKELFPADEDATDGIGSNVWIGELWEV